MLGIKFPHTHTHTPPFGHAQQQTSWDEWTYDEKKDAKNAFLLNCIALYCIVAIEKINLKQLFFVNCVDQYALDHSTHHYYCHWFY